MFAPPPASDLVLVACVLGGLYLVRFLLAANRLGTQAHEGGGNRFVARLAAVRTRGAFGEEREPERRHALRQLYIGAFFALVGAALAGWLVTQSVLGPFLSRAAEIS